MVDNVNLDNLRELLRSEAGIALKKFLIGHILDLKDIDNLKDLSDPKELSIEVKAQKKAFVKLVDILEELAIITTDYKKERSEKDQYYSM